MRRTTIDTAMRAARDMRGVPDPCGLFDSMRELAGFMRELADDMGECDCIPHEPRVVHKECAKCAALRLANVLEGGL